MNNYVTVASILLAFCCLCVELWNIYMLAARNYLHVVLQNPLVSIIRSWLTLDHFFNIAV